MVLFLLNPECVLTLRRQFRDLNLFLVSHNTLFEPLQVLGVISKRVLLMCVPCSLRVFELVLHSVFLELGLDSESLKHCLLGVLLSELSLHVLEESAGADSHISDLNGCEVDSPTLHNLCHLLDNCFT